MEESYVTSRVVDSDSATTPRWSYLSSHSGVRQAQAFNPLLPATARNPLRSDFRSAPERPKVAETAEIGVSPVDSATGRDVPDTRLRAIVATPSGSTADQASPRRERQHFRVRDPSLSLGAAGY